MTMASFTFGNDITFSYSGNDYLDITRCSGDYDSDFEEFIPASEIDDLIGALTVMSKEYKQMKKCSIERRIMELQSELDSLKYEIE